MCGVLCFKHVLPDYLSIVHHIGAAFAWHNVFFDAEADDLTSAVLEEVLSPPIEQVRCVSLARSLLNTSRMFPHHFFFLSLRHVASDHF